MFSHCGLVSCAAVTRDILSGNLRTISYFNLETLKKATKNFNQLNLLGRGGFGPVYLVRGWNATLHVFVIPISYLVLLFEGKAGRWKAGRGKKAGSREITAG